MASEPIRKIHAVNAKSEPLGDASGIADDAGLLAWLQKNLKEHAPTWLLAHADDGVIWGRYTPKAGLVTSHDLEPTVSPPLREITLQQARLFAVSTEILLWRDEDGWRARLVQDGCEDAVSQWHECYDEHQMLWGNRGTALEQDFTLWEEGARGLRHAVPWPLPETGTKPPVPPRLWVRHYLTPSGIAAVELSRLCGLVAEGAPLPVSGDSPKAGVGESTQ